jgi:chemotaxis protein CheZ
MNPNTIPAAEEAAMQAHASDVNGAGQLPAASDMYQRIGLLTRSLHDALRELGYDKQIEDAVHSLPDARTRLSYIARLTGQAADKVLNTVDQAKTEQERLVERGQTMAESLRRDPVAAVATGQALLFAEEVQQASGRLGEHLTSIMMAQDFHDLTGQVIHKVVNLAQTLEEQLLKLLLEATPPEQRSRVAVASTWINGPAMDAEQRTDVVSNQEQVDDLLDSLGF